MPDKTIQHPKFSCGDQVEIKLTPDQYEQNSQLFDVLNTVRLYVHKYHADDDKSYWYNLCTDDAGIIQGLNHIYFREDVIQHCILGDFDDHEVSEIDFNTILGLTQP